MIQEGGDVYGSYRLDSNQKNIEHLLGRLHLYQADLLDAPSLSRIVEASQPDYIFHLAAQSNVTESWRIPAKTMEINLVGTVNLLEAVRDVGVDPVIQIACSSEEHGLVTQEELPITEESPFRPVSPYAVSRVAVDLLGHQYAQNYGMKIVRTRAFNHTGARQPEHFVCSKFAKKIAEIEKGLIPPVFTVGNLDARRDFTDVRDIVRAYALAVTKATPGEAYVICSGVPRSIEEVLKTILHFSTVTPEVQKDPLLQRPSDAPILYGDSGKFTVATGWTPQIPFEQTMHSLLDYWRTRL